MTFIMGNFQLSTRLDLVSRKFPFVICVPLCSSGWLVFVGVVNTTEFKGDVRNRPLKTVFNLHNI